jgi:serine/threonine/tyrosine-interacting protein
MTQPFQNYGFLLEPVEWRYAMRREYQEIIPGLFLGPYHVARNIEALQRQGISHCIIIRDPLERGFLRPLFPNQLQYLEIEVASSNLQSVIPYFLPFRKFVQEAQCLREQYTLGLQVTPETMNRSVVTPPVPHGNVLVYCRDGISLSPTFVIAYLMEVMQMPFSQAYLYLQNRRFCLNPNDGLKLQLQVGWIISFAN